MSDAEKQQVGAEIPQSTYRVVKERLDHGEITHEIRQLMDRLAHGDTTSRKKRLQDELEELRQKRETAQRKRNDLDKKIENLNSSIERAERKLDEVRDREGRYEATLEMIENGPIEDGKHVFETHKQIQKAAEVGDCDPKDVLEDLKSRNPELPESRFSEKSAKDPSII